MEKCTKRTVESETVGIPVFYNKEEDRAITRPAQFVKQCMSCPKFEKYQDECCEELL